MRFGADFSLHGVRAECMRVAMQGTEQQPNAMRKHAWNSKLDATYRCFPFNLWMVSRRPPCYISATFDIGRSPLSLQRDHSLFHGVFAQCFFTFFVFSLFSLLLHGVASASSLHLIIYFAFLIKALRKERNGRLESCLVGIEWEYLRKVVAPSFTSQSIG